MTEISPGVKFFYMNFFSKFCMKEIFKRGTFSITGIFSCSRKDAALGTLEVVVVVVLLLLLVIIFRLLSPIFVKI